jgi:hypothetical protein
MNLKAEMFVYRFRLSGEFWKRWVDGRWVVKVGQDLM